jgi:hypothetical protein
MIVCNNCSYRNREGYYYCEDCGFPLDASAKDRTNTQQLKEDDIVLSARATWGTARLTESSQILLQVNDSKAEPIHLSVAARSVVGREDVSSNHHPDIDLVPFGGLEKGVSRSHAMIQRSEDTLTIVDMGSSNGTYLNGQRLVSNQPRVLRDGDEIRFGKLVTRIFFK